MVEGVCVGQVCKEPEFKDSNGRKILNFVLKHGTQFKGEFKPSFLYVSYYGDPRRFVKKLEVGDLVFVSGQVTPRKNEKSAYLSMMARMVDNSLGALTRKPEPPQTSDSFYQGQSYPQERKQLNSPIYPSNQGSYFDDGGFA